MSSLDLPPLGSHDRSVASRLQTGGMRPQDPMAQGPEGIRRVPDPGSSIDSREISGSAPRFSGVLADSLAKVQALQDDVRAKTRGLALGEDVEVHDVLIAASKSEVAFNLMLEVRNKLVEAWEKLSRSAG